MVIPAHDEGLVIGATVRSVAEALRHARRRGVIGAGVIQVVAHRCSDDTAERASAAMSAAAVDYEVMQDVRSTGIGAVRDAAARRGLDRLGAHVSQCWIFSTDADTLVPRDWVTSILERARRRTAQAVVGMTELDRFRGTRQARQAYRRLLAAKLVDGDELREHDHVYGANLAVRADAYLMVGGFPHVAHGEDQALVDSLLGHGVRVLRSRKVVVTTSGRLHGRADGGLATLLRRLDEPGHVSADQSWAPPEGRVNASAAPPTVKG